MTLRRDERQAEMTFCPRCGARLWQMRGLDTLTCRRGHHWPMPRGWEPVHHDLYRAVMNREMPLREALARNASDWAR